MSTNINFGGRSLPIARRLEIARNPDSARGHEIQALLAVEGIIITCDCRKDTPAAHRRMALCRSGPVADGLDVIRELPRPPIWPEAHTHGCPFRLEDLPRTRSRGILRAVPSRSHEQPRLSEIEGESGPGPGAFP